MKADLHIHSTYSDGVCSPEEIVRMASKQKIKCISITDHDCVDGIDEAIEAGKKYNVIVLPGVEFSCYLESDSREVHILGYLHDYKNRQLTSFLKRFTAARRERARKIIEKLSELGMEIDIDHVMQVSGEGTVGRPHVAKVIVEKGYAHSVNSAFYKYLVEGAPAYIKKTPFTIEAAITLAHKASGFAVWAHPNLQILKKHVKEYARLGLDGLEAFHPKLPPKQSRRARKLAKEYNLFITGGSDWHREEMNGAFGVFPVEKDKIRDFLNAYFNASL
jgi:hypothetical protein